MIVCVRQDKRGGEDLKQRARKETPKREWSRSTSGSYMCSARLPDDLAERLKAYVGATMATITDTMIDALDDYLAKRGF